MNGRWPAIEVTLDIEAIVVDVDVAGEAQVRNTNPNGPAFSNVLTAEQIGQLPDDLEELENAINQLAGPGAQIRVNGFRGGKLPPKNQIREIRFRLIRTLLRITTRVLGWSISPPGRARIRGTVPSTSVSATKH